MRKAILILFLAIAPNLFSQDNEAQDVRIVNHQVMMGETVRMISKKYLVPPADIYRLNKFAVDGIKEGMILKIPVPVKDDTKGEPATQEAPPDITAAPAEEVRDVEQAMHDVDSGANADAGSKHRVASGETLSGLAQHYGTTVEAIKEANPQVAKRGLRADETIKIPSHASRETAQSTGETSDTEAQNIILSGGIATHTVKAGETLFGLAKKYNVSVDVIKQHNPSIVKKGLQTGQVLKISAE